MSHSNTSLNTFTNCMKSYEHAYILNTPRDHPESPHLKFGVLGHKVLQEAGLRRDECLDNVEDSAEVAIPSELLYPDLKEFFGITSWHEYFMQVLTETTAIEQRLCSEMPSSFEIKRECKLSLSSSELACEGYRCISNSLVGVIDLLLLGQDNATIVDYKFSTKPKTQDNFDMDSQLYVYAYLVHKIYKIPLKNIRVGYIDICKKQYDFPKVLSNGRLSVDKSQFVLPEVYKAKVFQLHGNDLKYNCEPGGYYYECYMNLHDNRQAIDNIQQLNIEAMKGIVDDVMCTAKLIDFMTQNHVIFPKKFDSYSCKNCDFLSHCKPWLNIW